MANATLAELFEAQVRRRPDAAALIRDGSVISYRQLDCHANQVANSLISQGLTRESLVGVRCDRSPEFIIAILGVLKAGCAYVPLDPQAPPIRLSETLKRLSAGFVLTAREQSVPELGAGLRCWNVESRDRFSANPVAVPTHCEQLAYVMFTSGSTGVPKSIGVSHRAVASFAADPQWRNGAHARVLLHSPLHFDASTYEIWVPLLNGGAIVLSPAHLPTIAELGDTIRHDNVTALFMTAGYFATVAATNPAIFATVRELWTGGDIVSREAVRAVQKACPEVVLVHVYGPTETTTFATSYRIPEQLHNGGSVVPIGLGMADARLFVLDEGLSLAPIGVTGELYVGGLGLARGYVGAAGETASRFVADPFGSGSRLYRTGDRVRWNRLGQLEFVGRTDGQVKIRGHRVELAEVEALLAGHPDVGQAVVTAHEHPLHGKQLVAHVVPERTGQTRISKQEENEFVANWREVYGSLYGSTELHQNGFVGWNSSYNGQPIDVEEMREWLEAVVRRLGAFDPKRVLEIGVGSGLLLSRLARRCETYWGTDFSGEAIDSLSRWSAADNELAGRVQLRAQEADDSSGLPSESFDLVVINSVTQYFPSLEYLVRVMENALAALEPGGSLFVGDVRNLRLQRWFHADVRTYRGVDPADALTALVDGDVESETELLIDPEFFHRFAAAQACPVHVGVHLKRGYSVNEMTRYRYDTVLHKVSGAGLVRPAGGEGSVTLSWGASIWNLSGLCEYITDADPHELRITGIPNARLRDVLAAARNVEHNPEHIEAAFASCESVDPEDLYRIGEGFGYQTRVSWPRFGEMHLLEVVFTKGTQTANPMAATCIPAVVESGSLDGLTNFPLAVIKSLQLQSKLHDYLAERLPRYAIPSFIRLHSALPLTKNGKFDRRALAKLRIPLGDGGMPPQSEVEEQLCDLFSEVLGIPGVGIDGDFFKLGGDSLSAMRLVSRIRAVLNVQIPLQDIFDMPTVAQLADRLPCDSGPQPRLARRTLADTVPMSFGQERMWFLSKLEGPSSTYNIPMVKRLVGPLDVEALASALRNVVARHEPLRTVVDDTPEGLRQSIRDLDEFQVEVRETASDELLLLLQEEARRPFDISGELPIRATIHRLRSDEHVLCLLVHQIAFDGWSIDPLWADVEQAYAAHAEGVVLQRLPLPTRYADYTLWQRELIGDRSNLTARAQQHLHYWECALADAPKRVAFPHVEVDGPVNPLDGHMVRFKLSRDLHTGLVQLAQDNSVTLFMVLHAALALLLSRLSGELDVVIGTVVANRGDVRMHDLIGFFVNVLVLRCDISGDPTLQELLQRVKRADLQAYEHQDLPFDLLVDLLQPERSGAHTPFFQVVLTLQNAPRRELALPGIAVEELQASTGASQFDFTLSMTETSDHSGAPNGIEAVVEHRTSLFSHDDVARIVSRFVLVLQAFVENLQTRGSEIELLDPAERKVLLSDWNDTNITCGHKCWPELFEEQTRRAPHRVVITSADREISYHDLNEAANRLARELIALDVGPEDVVGVHLPRGIAFITAVIAVAKAGGAFLVLAQDLPRDRMGEICADVRPRVVISASREFPIGRVRVIELEDPDTIARISGRSAHNITDLERTYPLLPLHPAYVVYTSGSSGKPKGVIVTHEGLPSLATTQLDRWAVTEDSAILQFAAASFDGIVWEICGALLTGAALVVGEPHDMLSESRLARLVAECAVTHATFPPAMLSVLDPSKFRGLRALIASGDVVSAELVRRWAPGRLMLNGYGPTETTVCATLSEPLGSDVGGVVPIGRGMADARLFVLDERLKLVPVGVAGELYVGGLGLARGYVGAAGETASRFVADPFGSGSRLYRTGDRVRWNRLGQLEFVGRSDRQVKIRGHRVELAEVEGLLERHPDVAQAVVTAYQHRVHGKQLVAHVVPACAERTGASQLQARELREDLLVEAPRHLVPDRIVILDEMPVTAAGKIDRSRLPKPDVAGRTSLGGQVGHLLPRTPVERELFAIFKNALAVDDLSIEDSFFALGGNSLQLTKVAELISRALGVDVSVSLLFERQSVVEVARVIEQGAARESVQPRNIRRIKLDPEIRRTDQTFAAGALNRVLLTGSTGFLGRYLLREFLVATDTEVYCAVRAASEEHAVKRIALSLGELGPVPDEWRQRIIPVPCDLEKPLLGLDERAAGMLAGSLDAICHNGANVSTMPYADLFATNVLGTQEVLRLASLSPHAGVHFVSTAAITELLEPGEEFPTDALDVQAGDITDDGYVAGKRVAEDLIWQAHDRGVPGAIYRPSLICGPANAPLSGSDAEFWRLVRLMLQIRAVPDFFGDDSSVFNVVPVDQVARLIVRGMSSPKCFGQTFHLTSPDPLAFTTLFDIFREKGFVLEPLPYHVWRRRLVDQIAGNRETGSSNTLLLADSLTEFNRLGKLQFCHGNLVGFLVTDLSDDFFRISGGALAAESIAALGLSDECADFKRHVRVGMHSAACRPWCGESGEMR
ncbi:non-ribosomal peptide synthetase [Mycobacterium simulans]|uniref:non-ribosomal peptide synthetase n=1 Tax=Mycobacterium simulans TaxID=627089 RepID=UPI001640322E|nr:non-ribosomal peptide synthetase [Mycobacterium simulans]